MPSSRDRFRIAFIRAAAVALAMAAAWVLASAVRTEEPNRPFVAVFFRVLAVTAPLQIGLIWSATARGWSRLWAGLLMVPSGLLLSGFVGEEIEKVLRGFPVKISHAVTWMSGALLYVWRFHALAFPRKRRAAR